MEESPQTAPPQGSSSKSPGRLASHGMAVVTNLIASAIWQWGFPVITLLATWVWRSGKTTPVRVWVEVASIAVIICVFYLILRAFRQHYQVVKKTNPPIPSRNGWRKWEPEIGMGAVLAVVTVWAFWSTPRQRGVSPDYIALNRPYLVPRLVIDSVTNGPRYHYQIENTGVLPASPITYQEQVEGAETREGEGVPITRELVHGAPMMLHTTLGDGIIPFAFHGESRLILSYHARIAGKDEAFQSLNRFSLSMPTAKPGEILAPVSPEILDQAPPVDSDAIKSSFLSPQGGAAYVVNETNKHSLVNGGIVNTSNKWYLFDPLARLVVFKSIGSNGQVFAVCRHLKPSKNGFHVIQLEWAPGGALLGVDGDFVSDPPSFGK